MKKAFLIFLTAILAFALVATGCSRQSNNTTPTDGGDKDKSAQTDSGKPVKGGTFTLAQTSDVPQLVPTLSQDTASTFMQNLIFDSLLRLDDKWQYQPWLATALPTIENNGMKWTFTLRKDAKFHDGQPLTAKDVQFTFQQIQHPNYQGVRASNYGRLNGIAALRTLYSDLNTQVSDKELTKEAADKQKLAAWEKWCKESTAILAPDDYTVVFNLDKVYAPMLGSVAGTGILPMHLLKDKLTDMKGSEYARNPIGSGQYKFVEWKTQDKITLKVNENWWGDKPYIDTFVWKVYPDSNTAMAALEKGEVDATSIEVESIKRFQAEVKHVDLQIYPSTSYRQLTLDLNNELFQDVKVRYALAHAIDKEGILQTLRLGYGEVAWSHATPQRWDYNAKVFKPVYDVKKAEQLLDEAGWKKGADGIRAKDGKKLAFDFIVSTGSKADMETAQVIQEAWKKVGVDANIKAVDDATLLDLSDAGNPDRKQPPVYLYGWSLGSEPDSYSIWHSTGSFNDIGYSNKRVDELLDMGRDEIDQAKRQAIYSEIQDILAKDQPYIWLYFDPNIDGFHKRVKGPIKGNANSIFWNFRYWWIDPGVK